METRKSLLLSVSLIGEIEQEHITGRFKERLNRIQRGHVLLSD